MTAPRLTLAEFVALTFDIFIPFHSPGDHAMWGRGTEHHPITEEGLPFVESCEGCQVRRYRDEVQARLTGAKP